MPSATGTGPAPGGHSGGRSDEPPGAGDPALAAEREHLSRSREFLRMMRENVLSLPAMAGDPLSEEFLKADLYRRAQALRDIPDTPLFFGRLDYAGTAGAGAAGRVAGERAGDGAGRRAGEGANGRAGEGADGRAGGGADGRAGDGARGRGGGTALPGESLHIGRRHVQDPDGRPVVIDWRAPVSRPFYRASPAEPMGLARRRRFGFSGGDLTAYEDEEFAAGEQTGAVSRILIEEIERPRSGPMRDIVATIQPEQDDIVRAGSGRTICVQGAPGTGKTAVGLHRVAYLIYAHPERMRRGGVLVIGPNQAFLSYIRGVLPALGEFDVRQVTIPDLLGAVRVRSADSAGAARVKGDARMAEVLRRAVWAGLTEPTEALLLVRGSRRWRVPAHELAGLAAALRERGVRYGSGRDMFGHRIAHTILALMEASGEACDDRTHESVRRSRPVRAAVDAIWPKADPVRLVMRLLSDPSLLARAAGGILTESEQRLIAWPAPPRGPASAPWTAADAALVDEAADLIERIPGLAHVVVDEAQDLSPMECRAVGRRCATGSATVLGDIAQGTTPMSATNWRDVLAHLGKPDGDLRSLATGYRVPRQILDFAGRLLPHIAPDLAPPVSLRQDPGSLTILPAGEDGLPTALARVCAEALAHPGSAAVIMADDQVRALSRALAGGGMPHAVLDGADADARLTLVPASLAKGLEFDDVVVVEPGRITADGARGLNLLYVALTRAVSRLTVLHAGPLPAPLADHRPW